MLIAIDFDETLTKDGKFWKSFIALAQNCGHRVICITARRDTEENNEHVDLWMEEYDISIPVYFTSLRSKVEFAKERGLKVDVWIDDDPKSCALGR